MFFESKISIKDKALFFENIANLLEGGVTLITALKGQRDRLPLGNLREAVDNILFFVESGDAVNIALRKLPNYFNEREVAIVESGEQTGMIQSSFVSIAEDLRSQEDLKNKITSAITYPIIILSFLVLAVTVVMIYVVPQLIPILEDASSEIPFMTQALILTSNFLKNHFVELLSVIFGLGLIFAGFIRTERGGYFWDRQKITLPIIGNVYKNYLVVRTMSTLNLLLSSGVSIIKSLRLTGESSGNVVIKKLFFAISEEITKGNKISGSMIEIDKENYFFSIDIIQMIESAEKTSTIDTVTLKIATQYKREVDFALSNMVKYIEPGALLLAGIFVLWFAIAIFGAIMQIVGIAGQ